MTDRTGLAARMKAYEHAWRTTLPRRLPLVCRLDGRSFHQYLRRADKPFDMSFVDQMAQVAQALCEEVAGTVFAYHQSDEISFLLCDYRTLNTQPWFGNELQKIVSVTASIAAAVLGDLRGGRPTFDARVFVLPGEVETANYFLWRQQDALRNSLSMAAQANVSSRAQLYKVNAAGLRRILAECGIDWNTCPARCTLGQVVVRDPDTGQWTHTAAPRFKADPQSWLATTIPPIPSFTSETPDD